ncbi:MAG: thioredoxin [Muribaculaceae bacterium]|nr:thioredoxin [Muribaculaceae bacterium]
MALTFTDENVKGYIESGQPVVIDFWATWCGPCVGMGPTIDKLAEEYEGKVAVGKYNIDEESDLSTEYRIMSIPTILFFKNGEMIKDLRLAGSQRIETLQEQVEKLLAL